MDARSRTKLSLVALVTLGLTACCFQGTRSSAPPPPASTAPTSAPTPTPTPTVVAPMPTVIPTAPSASSVELAQDQLVCGAALHCCEAAAREARMVARMEGVDPRRDSRYDPQDRYDPEMDPRRDPRLRAPARLASSCRELRNGTDLGATRCAAQIEGMRRAFREARISIPSTCTMPDMPAAPSH